MKTRTFGTALLMLLLATCEVVYFGAITTGCEKHSDSGDEQTSSQVSADALPAQDSAPVATSQESNAQQPQSASTIRYSGIRNVDLWTIGPFDVNGDSKTDFRLSMETASEGYFLTEPGNMAVGPLSAESPIGSQSPASGWFSDKQLMASWLITASIPPEMGTAGGAWAGVNNGYMGLVFLIDGSVHYGWARISIPATGDNMGTLHDWAYETRAGVGIKAGQTE